MFGLESLYIGTALGIGNFLILPKLFSLYDFRLVLFFHFLGLLLLGIPLVVGEILWARWLRRSCIEAFGFLGAPYSWTPWVSLAALLFITPLYVLEILRLILGLFDVVGSASGTSTIGLSHPSAFWTGGALLLMMWLYTAIPRRWIGTIFTVGIGGAALCLLASLAIQLPAYAKFWAMDFPSASRNFSVTKEMFLDVASYSLFTVSAGMGIHFLFTLWASPFRRSTTALAEYWKRPGRVHRIAIKVLLADFMLSVVVSLLIVPWVQSPLTGVSGELSFHQIVLEWMPEFFRASDTGLLSPRLLFAALLMLGLLSLASLYEVFLHGVQRLLGLKRMVASALMSALIGIFSLVASVQFFGRPLETLAFDFLLPFSALLWSLSVGRKLPKRDLAVLVGRSPSSDALSLLWRGALLSWVPLFLSFYLLLRLLSLFN